MTSPNFDAWLASGTALLMLVAPVDTLLVKVVVTGVIIWLVLGGCYAAWMLLGNRGKDNAGGRAGGCQGPRHIAPAGTCPVENIKPLGEREIPSASNKPSRRDPSRDGCPTCKI